jgi:excisionase family DNA binding protein
MTASDLLTVAEVATELGVNPATVRVWLRSGRIDAIKVGPRQWRVPRAALAGLSTSTPATPATMPAPLSTAIQRLEVALAELEAGGQMGTVARVMLAARSVVDAANNRG